MMRRSAIVFPFAAVLALATGWPQTHPDFSGVWKLSLVNSDFAGEGKPDSKVQSVVQRGNDLSVTIDEVVAGKPAHGTSRCTLDGKEAANDVLGNLMKSTIIWDGTVLVMRTRGSFGGTDIALIDRWPLSVDGRTLIMKRHFEGHGLVSDQTLVYDKQ
jgi:hypothetical protein